MTVPEGIRAKVSPDVEVLYASGSDIQRDIQSFFQDFVPGVKKPEQPPAEAEAAFQQALETAHQAETVVMGLGENAHMSGEAAHALVEGRGTDDSGRMVMLRDFRLRFLPRCELHDPTDLDLMRQNLAAWGAVCAVE